MAIVVPYLYGGGAPLVGGCGFARRVLRGARGGHGWQTHRVIEIDGPFYRISDPGFEMLIPCWEGHDPETADQADATITLPEGTRRYATFMTLGAISGIMDRWQGTGECLNGRYFWCSDLVIIRKPGFVSMADAVRDMIAIEELESACSALPIDDNDQPVD